MTTSLIRTAFAAGEISPQLYGQVSLAKFSTGATTMRNMFVGVRGGAMSRAGTKFIAPSFSSFFSSPPPRLITFQFSINQGICLEFGNQYLTFYINGAPVLEAGFSIAAITLATPCVITVPGNDFAPGQRIILENVGGTTQLNGRAFYVRAVSGADVTLQSIYTGNGIDATNYGAFTGNGLASRVYLIGTPYVGEDVATLKFAESADVMSIAHPNYPPYELARITNNDWVLAPAAIGNTGTPPGQPLVFAQVLAANVVSTPATLPAAYAYVVTAIDANGFESNPSPVGNATNGVDMASTAGSNIVEWPAVAGAAYYFIYRAPTSYNTASGNPANAAPVPPGAIFSFVGISYGVQFVDTNITPDTARTPPLHQNPFAPGAVTAIDPVSTGGAYTTATVTIASATGTGFAGTPIIVGTGIFGYIVTNGGQNYLPSDTVVVSGDGSGASGTARIGPQTGTYPSVVAYVQQRRAYANTINQPDTYFMSVPGQYLNFDTSVPVEAGDAIIGTPWAQQVNGIQWMVQQPAVVVAMTGDGLWVVTGQGGSPTNPVALTPSSQQAIPQGGNGVSATVPPIAIKNEFLFVDSIGFTVNSAVYSFFTQNYPTTELTVLSQHLLFGQELTQWAWCREPYKIIWAIRCDGVMLSLTYLKEQEIYGWARHDTQGQFLSVTAVTEPPVNALYLVVLRQTPAGPFYMIERMDDRIWTTAEDPWAVDAGVQNAALAPNVVITADSVTGAVNFMADAPAFPADGIGLTLRIANGIAQITSFTDTQHVGGMWVLDPTALVPIA